MVEIIVDMVIIGLCIFVLHNPRARGITQRFLDSTLGVFFKKGRK